jgi:glutamate-1-semialdehyde 2,1-aminomutase
MAIPPEILAELAEQRQVSKSWWERGQAAIAAGSTSRRRRIPPFPFYASHGIGSRLFDVDGNEYLDCVQGFGPHILGHAHPVVVEAIQQSVTRSTTFGTPHPDEVLFAELLTEMIPCTGKVNFLNSGSEATAATLRVARAMTGKPGIAKFEGGFHGGYDAVLGSFAVDPDTSGPVDDPIFTSISFGAPAESLVHTYVLPFNHEAAFQKIRRLSSELAIVMVEGVQGFGGAIPAERWFLEGLRDVCSETGVLLMFDEVITGFRLALGGAQEYFGVRPDLATYGKAPGGGLPLGIIAGTDEAMYMLESTGDFARDLKERAYFGGTFNAGVPVTVVGAAILTYLRDHPEIFAHINELGDELRQQLGSLIAETGITATVVGAGSMFGVRFVDANVRSVRDLVAENKVAYAAMQALLLRHGVFVSPSFGVFSAAHSTEDVAEIVAAYRGAFDDLERTGLLDSA